MKQVRLNELLGSLSLALDITEGQPQGHCIRCCHIGMALGQSLGLSSADLADLYYTILLKDLGCSANAARVCSSYLTDDITFKRDFKLVDGSLPQIVKFLFQKTGTQSGMAQKFKTMVHRVFDAEEMAQSLIETRCQRGAEIAEKMHFGESVAQGILCLDEHWDGKGRPLGLAKSEIPLFSQIALLAQLCDVYFANGGTKAAISEVTRRSGTWFDPQLVATFCDVAKDPTLWDGLRSPTLQQEILSLEPAGVIRLADEDWLDDIASGFAQVVDAKSPFTAGHSERVTIYADLIATEMGYAPHQLRWLQRAALLHDIGKLGVSNSVLDKPGRLTEAEFGAIKLHPVYSREILRQVDVFKDIAAVAGGHHEKLNGKGYPDGLRGDEIDLNTRIVAVADVFDALTADRPYRKAMAQDKALEILDDMAAQELDPICLDALKSGLSQYRNIVPLRGGIDGG